MGEVEPGFVHLKGLAKVLEEAWLKSAKERGILKYYKKTPPETNKFRRISICTTVMNRLGDLQQTLPKNMKDNEDYPNIQFVILDYNSSDGLQDWIAETFQKEISLGRLKFARTAQPKYYSMTHSRNLAFKVADGEIVNNLDADNYCKKGFAHYINRLAEAMPEKAIFGKSRQLLRGRLGFYKDEWVELGGYDQNLKNYGHDDADLLHRAWEMGFTLMPFSWGGDFVGNIENHQKHLDTNMTCKWWESEGENRLISFANLLAKRFIANEGREWGKAHLIVNFNREVDI